ncbi:MAG TPA: hemerythrin domain-containing protein [Pilimelia sp.]|nr:hemerythrin domain-containing protein [Pilimelia sp.]
MTAQHRRVSDKDLVDVLLTDHREIETLFRRWESADITATERRTLTDVAIAELVRHAVAEEEYLYPTIQEILPDGVAVAEREIAAHAEVERLMKDLEARDAEDPDFLATGRSLIAAVRAHVAEEEAELFPALREACAPSTLERLAGMAEMAKASAPTRPHPSAPDHPPWNMLLAPGLGLVDRLRDALRSRPTHAEDLR